MPAPPSAPTDSQVRLHVVTGKGGVGKTTVASALALALAAEGKQVLAVEVEGRGGLAAAFGIAPGADLEEVTAAELPGGGSVRLLDVDPRAALLEYLRLKVPFAPAASVLTRLGAVDFATTIAPGTRDVIVLGKVYEAVGRERRGRVRRPVYDAVVVDAPPTGRVGRFLSAPAEIASLAQVGPVRRQADSITRLLQGPGTRVHIVTLLEEMPVQETLEAATDLGERSLRLGSIVVNEDVPDLLGAARGGLDADEAEAEIARGLAAAGIDADAAPALLAQARQHAETHDARAVLRQQIEEIGIRIRSLPLLSGGVGVRGLHVLAGELGGVR